MEISKSIDKQIIIVSFLIILGILWRLAPHIPNFAPIGAIALILGMMTGWRKSLMATAIIMGVSDFIIGAYPGIQWTWLGFGLIIVLGYGIKNLSLAWRIPVGAFGASLIFFIVSNFGTWISSGMYTLDLAGLIQCYTMALPFFRATLASDLMFTALLLSSYEAYKLFTHLPAIQPIATNKRLYNTPST